MTTTPFDHILIRGRFDGPDGAWQVTGAHVADFVSAGAWPDGKPRYDVASVRPITTQEVTDYLDSVSAQMVAQIAALQIERDALASERDALAPERDALAAQMTTQAATIESLKAQLRAELGTPVFKAADLLAQITDAEKDHITQFVANDDQLRPLWSAFLGRVVGAPIAIDSPTFLAAADGLKQALGEPRVAELFTALNIDLVAGAYIDPAQAA